MARSGRKLYPCNKREREIVAKIVRLRRRRRGAAGPTPYNAIARELNESGVRTRDGKHWQAKQVREILYREQVVKPVAKRIKKTHLARRDYLTPTQIDRCRGVCRDERELIIFETLLGSAVRASEFCNLQQRDFFLDEEPYEIQVRRGKGSKQRSVIVGDRLAALLRKWLKNRTGAKVYAFENCAGRPMDRRQLWYLIKGIGKRAGIPSLHPHTLRHTWATLCDYETAVFDIVEQLGHSSAEVTRIYRKVRSEHRIRTAREFEKMAGPEQQMSLF